MKVRAKDLSARLFRVWNELKDFFELHKIKVIDGYSFTGDVIPSHRARQVLQEVEDIATILYLVEDPDDLQD